MEFGEVGGEGRILEPAAIEQASSRRSAPEYARRVFGESEASARRRAVERGGTGRGNPSSPPQTFDPRVAGFGDPDLEAVEA